MVINIKEYAVIIDDEDYEKVSRYTWNPQEFSRTKTSFIYFVSYVRDNTNKKITFLLHRVIAGCVYKDGKTVDHINHNTMDNRKQNLRICTAQENAQNKKVYNKTGYKGVSWQELSKKWRASIRVNNKTLFLGSFSDIEDAASIYDMCALYYFKEFALTNFSKNNYTNADIIKAYRESLPNYNYDYTTRYRGVQSTANGVSWSVSINIEKVPQYIGTYSTAEEAARVYDMLAIKLQGKSAKTNFNKELYSNEAIEDTYARALNPIKTTPKSGYRGVFHNKRDQLWYGTINHNNVQYYTGSYQDPEKAARSRDRKAIELLGDKAILNFPREDYIKERNNEQETAK